MSTRYDRMKRIEQGNAARERVLSGEYNQPAEPYQSSRNKALSAYMEQNGGKLPSFESSSISGIMTAEDGQRYAAAAMARARDEPITYTATQRPQTVTPMDVTMSNLNAFQQAAQGNPFAPKPQGPGSMTERKMAEKQAAQDFIERDRARRDAQDPKNPFFKAVKDNTVDLLGEGITRLQVNNPIGRAFSRIADKAGDIQGVDTQAAGGAPVLSTGNKFIDKASDIAGYGTGLLVDPSMPAQVGASLTGVGTLFKNTKVGKAFTEFISRKPAQEGFGRAVDAVEPPRPQGTLALPEATDPATIQRYNERMELLRRSEGTTLTPGRRAINMPGDPAPTFALPEGNALPPTRARVEQRANPYRDKLESLFETARQTNMPPGREREALEDLWSRMAERNDPGLDELIDLASTTRREVGRDALRLARETQRAREVAGAPLPIRSQADRFPQEVGEAFPPTQRLAFTPKQSQQTARQNQGLSTRKKAMQESTQRQAVEQNQGLSTRKRAMQEANQRADATNNGSAQRLVAPKPQGPVDELKFAQTVKNSPNSAPELVRTMNEGQTLVGARTSDVLNRQQADNLIEKHGREGLYAKLMDKKLNLSPAESTAAQALAKHFSSQGDKESMAKAISLISKTAREGREMGQAIQALSQWNKLDETGALLLGQRQLNRGVSDMENWRELTPEQGAPIKEAAQRVGQAQQVKSLADEVLAIVSNKKPGEALAEAEKAVIKQFQEQVKMINEKAKGFLPKSKSAVQETIEKVSKTPPKERTRDQVVNLLEAKAQQARARIARSRGIGFAATDQGNIVADYAIIISANIARGIVRYADNAERIIQDFGQGAKPYLQRAYTKGVNVYRKENGLPTTEQLDRVVSKAVKMNQLDEETAQALKVVANEIGFYTDKNLKLEATQDLQKALKGLGTSTLGEKLSTLQTGAQLLNFVTISRNIIGNAAQMTAEKMNKMVAVPIDWAFSTMTKERTIKFLPQNQENMFRNFMGGTSSGWEGVSPTGTLSSYDIYPEVFGNKNPLKYVSKALGASLQGFDFAAYRSAYGDVVATYAEQLGKAQKLNRAQIKKQMPKLIEQLDDRIHEMADQAGLYATFQDETLLSQGAQLLKRGLNKLSDVPASMLVERGLLPKSLSTEGFGLGDVVLKYARTPANLIMRGIDYSPLGFVRATMEIAPFFINRSKFNQFQATRALSRAITGTLGLTGMGYILADAGILTGSSSMDKDERSIQEQSGQGAYKVNWSALGRFLTSGFDKNSAKYRKGDRMMDYAWLQPAAISVAMGVNANKAVKEREEGEDVSGWQVAQKAILGGLASVLENPMVQGVSNVIEAGTEIVKYQKADRLKGIIKGVPASFVPTLSNQARAATDNYQRETADENLLTEMGNMMKNKIPGLSKKLPVSYDSLGKPRERIQGGEANTVRQYLTSFFSPARMTKYEVTPEAKLVLDLMNESGDKNVLPRINQRFIQVTNPQTMKDENIDLTGEQFSRLQNKVGEEVSRRLAEYADYLSDPNGNAEAKAKLVKKILNDVGQKVRNDFRVEMGYETKKVR